jgi:glycosyltransferase involved in cell wall biosynthesis
MVAETMHIVQINTFDVNGGAEKISLDLHLSFMNRNIESSLLVGQKISLTKGVVEFPKNFWYVFWDYLLIRIIPKKILNKQLIQRLIRWIKDPVLEFNKSLGIENYFYPSTRKTINQLISEIDLIHFHNLHGNYFDLTFLPEISKIKPVLITLHDQFLLTGHCAYSIKCKKWISGCGNCPDLKTYPPLKKDNTRWNFLRKSNILKRSKITFVVPSNWLKDEIRKSALLDFQIKVIKNGINLEIFHPYPKNISRKLLNLNIGSKIVLFAAVGGRNNSYKDYDMLERVIEKLKDEYQGESLILLAIGGSDERSEVNNKITFIEKKYVNDPKIIAQYYSACDLFIHTAKADNAPLVLMESMACGLPIISTNVGGISEIVEDGKTGYLVPSNDVNEMVSRIMYLLDNDNVCRKMSENAIEIAKAEFNLNRMVDEYLSLYYELINRESK